MGISFPILAGLSRGHPWAKTPGLSGAVACLPVILLGAYLTVRGRSILASLREGRPSPAVLGPLLMAANLVIFWTVPVELAHLRPRYILPLMMAFAVHLGVVVAWVWARSRIWATLGMASILALNVFGTVPRLLAGRGISDYYDRLIRSLDEKGIRTGYADFSVAAPVTMFTGERIVLSPRLGPTPNFESRIHARIVDRAGPDSLILRGRESPESLARRLRALGVTYRLDTELVPVFYDFSRRLRFQEVAGFRQGAEPNRKRRRAGRRRRPAE